MKIPTHKQPPKRPAIAAAVPTAARSAAAATKRQGAARRDTPVVAIKAKTSSTKTGNPGRSPEDESAEREVIETVGVLLELTEAAKLDTPTDLRRFLKAYGMKIRRTSPCLPIHIEFDALDRPVAHLPRDWRARRMEFAQVIAGFILRHARTPHPSHAEVAGSPLLLPIAEELLLPTESLGGELWAVIPNADLVKSWAKDYQVDPEIAAIRLAKGHGIGRPGYACACLLLPRKANFPKPRALWHNASWRPRRARDTVAELERISADAARNSEFQNRLVGWTNPAGSRVFHASALATKRYRIVMIWDMARQKS